MPRTRSDSKCKQKFKDAQTKDQLMRQNSFVKKQLKLNRPPTPPVEVESEFILVRFSLSVPRREHQQRNTKQVVGNSKSLARRAVDAMGRECKHGVKFIGMSEATKYRFGRPVQVLVDEDVRLTPTFEICLNQWQQIGCDVWYFADDSSFSDGHGTKLHIRGLVFRKKEKDDDDDVVYSSAK